VFMFIVLYTLDKIHSLFSGGSKRDDVVVHYGRLECFPTQFSMNTSNTTNAISRSLAQTEWSYI